IAAPERITVRRQGPNGDQIFKVNAKKFTKGSGGGFCVEPGGTITVGGNIFLLQNIFGRSPFSARLFVYGCSRHSAVIDPSQSSVRTTASTDSETPVVADLTGHYADGLQKFDVRRFWHSFLERIWIVAICVLAGFFLALGYLARTPKLYQGHTVLEVEFQEPSFLPTDDSATRMRSVFLASQEALRTIEQNLTNQTLLSRVVRSEGLAADGGHALFGQTVVIDKKSSAPQRTETPQPRAQGQSASAGTTFTPLEEGLGRAMAGMVRPAIRR